MEQMFECGICFKPYNHNDKKPISLPCGHSFCRHTCLAPWLREKTACPECRAPCPPALPKANYALSALSRLARGVGGAAAAEEEAAARTAEEAALEAFLASGARAPPHSLHTCGSGHWHAPAAVTSARKGLAGRPPKGARALAA